MARKYAKKFSTEKPKIKAQIIKRRDGHCYGLYQIPLEISNEALEWQLSDNIAGLHLFFQDWVKKGGFIRQPYGAKSDKHKKLKERDKLIYEIYREARNKGVKWMMMPDIINNELRRRKYLQKGKALSDERIRKIIAKFR